MDIFFPVAHLTKFGRCCCVFCFVLEVGVREEGRKEERGSFSKSNE